VEENICGMMVFTVERCGIDDQPNALPLKQMKIAAKQDIETNSHNISYSCNRPRSCSS
jgi:hypothetical protein